MKRFARALLVVLLLALIATPIAFAASESGDRVVFGESYVLGSGERLDGNLTVIGGTATLEPESYVSGDVVVLGGTLSHSGTIAGSLSVFGGSTSLKDGSVVQGSVASFGGELDRSFGAVVQGDVMQGPSLPATSWAPSQPSNLFPHFGNLLAWEFTTLGWSVFLALLGMLAIAVAPRGMERIATTAARDLPMSLGLGLLTWVVVALAGLVLLIACGLGLLVWLALIVSLLVGWLAVGLWVGQRLLQLMKTPNASSIWEIALGVFVITILSRIPWLCMGGLFGIILGAVGLGAIVLTRFGTQMPPKSAGPSLAAGDAAVAPEGHVSSGEIVTSTESSSIHPVPDDTARVEGSEGATEEDVTG